MQSARRQHQHHHQQQLQLQPPTWNGGELCGGKLSPMHLDCCQGEHCDAAGAKTQGTDQPLLMNSAAQNLKDDRHLRVSLTPGGTSDQEAVIGSWPPLPPKGIRKKAAETLGFSAVAMEMLREQEDRDLHPFGRGGRFEGVLYSRRVKVQVDHTKFLAWIVFASFILLTSGAIIFLAEMERRQKFQQSLLPTTTISTIDGLSHGNRNG